MPTKEGSLGLGHEIAEGERYPKLELSELVSFRPIRTTSDTLVSNSGLAIQRYRHTQDRPGLNGLDKNLFRKPEPWLAYELLTERAADGEDLFAEYGLENLPELSIVYTSLRVAALRRYHEKVQTLATQLNEELQAFQEKTGNTVWAIAKKDGKSEIFGAPIQSIFITDIYDVPSIQCLLLGRSGEEGLLPDQLKRISPPIAISVDIPGSSLPTNSGPAETPMWYSI